MAEASGVASKRGLWKNLHQNRHNFLARGRPSPQMTFAFDEAAPDHLSNDSSENSFVRLCGNLNEFFF